MAKYSPPRVIIVLDAELGSVEADAAILDTGIVVYVLNDDNTTYTLKRWYHHLDTLDGRNTDRSMSRRTIDWWCKDARSQWNPDIHTQAYINMNSDDLRHIRPNGMSSRDESYHRMHLIAHAMFIRECLDKYSRSRTDFVVCAKGPDTDCTIFNHAFAMAGIDFNYRFARYSSLRDIERVGAALRDGGWTFHHPERDECSIPFAPKDYYSSGAFRQQGAELDPWFGMPPANPHTGLYDAWLEGLDAVEHYTLLNRFATFESYRAPAPK